MTITRCVRPCVVFMMSLALGSHLGLLAPASASGSRPSGLLALRSGDVVVLDAERGLLRLSPRAGITGAWADIPIPGAATLSLKSGGKEEVYLTQLRVWATENSTNLLRLDNRGGVKDEWHLPHSLGQLAGAAVAPAGGVAYLSSSRRAEIYRLQLDTKRTSPKNVALSLIATIPRATTLGAIVVDAKRERVLAADPVDGTLYYVPSSGGAAVKLVGGLGEPGGLAIDASTDRLFVSDRSGCKLWVLPLDREPVAAVFAASGEMRAPVGVTVGVGGQVWVLEKKAKKVFLYSKEGKLLHTYVL
jgi:DNA-binding beta-propeller fold protein YncE